MKKIIKKVMYITLMITMIFSFLWVTEVAVSAKSVYKVNTVYNTSKSIKGKTKKNLKVIVQIGNKKYSKGVKIELEGKKVTVDIFVNVRYGVRIPDVAWAAQTAVKNAVENMTGLEVAAVNINVQGIIFDKEEKPKAAEQTDKTEE